MDDVFDDRLLDRWQARTRVGLIGYRGFEANPPSLIRPLAVESHDDGKGPITVVFSGELDMGTAPSAEEELRRVEAEHRPILVDLRRLRFIDSTGLHMILAADRRVREAGERLVLVRGPHVVQRVFEITRAHERLSMIDSSDSVTAALDGSPRRVSTPPIS